MPYVGGRVWVDVTAGQTAPPGAPDLEATTLNAMESDIAAAFDFKPHEWVVIMKDPVTGFWPAAWGSDNRTPSYVGGAPDAMVRPTARADVHFVVIGANPSPGIVTSGTGGMLSGSDFRLVTP